MEKNLTTKQMEELVGVSRQTLTNWIKRGLIPAPAKDYKNWYVWDSEAIKNVTELLKQMVIENNSGFVNQIEETVKIANRRYLGSKYKLLPFIDQIVKENTKDISSVADIFGGTGVVSDLFNKQGKKIIVNDILAANYISYLTWFGNESVDYDTIKQLITDLNNINSKKDNYFSENFGGTYFTKENARKIGEIREEIENIDVNNRERAFLLTSLVYATDKVANTVGHYDAYRETLDTTNELYLRVPELNVNENNEIYQEDANELVKRIKADLVYIDTPYNSRQYGDSYHLLENLVEWKKPEVYGKAHKMDRSHIKSKYNTKSAPEAFEDLISNVDSRYILVSYNNMAQKGNGRSNAKISNEEIIETLEKRGDVEVFDTPFKVYNTGKTNIDNHKELLYLCTVI